MDTPKTYLRAHHWIEKRELEYREDVQEIEATVAEEVVGRESANFAVGVEGDFVDGAVLEVLVECWTLLVGRIPRHEILFEPRTHVQICRMWEECEIPCVVPMPMTPHDSIDFLVVDTTFTQKLIDIFGNVETRYAYTNLLISIT